ncbi:Transcriptional regulator GZF3 [Cercospora beticola]|uniref:Transcriptional regulator GZF3 n=1 Tax=Cercospora beticola TaxID=122368 RepID=A0A2G5I5L0_CERBT|nr:Transcriptional regulator GZF3 [Cercospora beticola]PIB00106.1 Transcriptional regulator GZF3 [Cercospora beticola]WPB00969.1 hypothetical protein RHO25_005589 [Cercospora beticola]
MLQYAVPNASQPFHRPPAVFAEAPRPPSGIAHREHHSTGASIPRPPSTASTHSSSHPRQASFSGRIGTDNISLATLASLAANAPAAVVSHSGDSTRSNTPVSTVAMSQSAPATAGYGNQNGSGPPICANCQTSTTPLWRRDESGSVLCNACGLFLKLHGRPRPISLKTDVIKSRNRVKASQAKKRDSHGGENGLQHMSNGYPAAHPDLAHLQHAVQTGHQHGLPMGSGIVGHAHDQQARPGSPNSMARSQTPGLHQQHSNPNIAPQHIFDTVSLPSDTFASPSLPHLALQQNGQQNGQLEQPSNVQDLLSQNVTLRTRVSELEVINDLFRGRVTELEQSENQTKERERAHEEEAQRLTAELATAHARAAELQRQLDELQQTQAETADGPARKKTKMESENGVDETGPQEDSAQAGGQ